MKVIILSITKYKEKDCIYNAVSEEGYLSFKAKGAQDSKGKFAWLNNPLTVADVEFNEDGRYKHKLLKSASPLSSPLEADETLEYLYSVYALTELSQNVLLDEEKHLEFKDLLDAIKAIKNGKDYRMVVLIYFAKLLKFSGAQLEVDRCVFCGGTKRIATFSFENGGFVCAECMKEGITKEFRKTQMQLIRAIFKTESCLYFKDDYSDDDKKLILLKLKEFADHTLGVSLKTIDYLSK